MTIELIKPKIFDKLLPINTRNRLAGITKVNGTPAKAMISIFNRYTNEIIASKWSDATTGEWEVRYLPEYPLKSLLVVSKSFSQDYNAEVADFITQTYDENYTPNQQDLALRFFYLDYIKIASFTLDNKKTTISFTGPNSWINSCAIVGKTFSSGKYYCEVKVIKSESANRNIFGFVDSMSFNNYPGYGQTYSFYGYDGKKYNNGVGTAFGSLFSENDIIGMAIDFNTKKMWFSINNVWQGSGNPATGINPAFSGFSLPLYPCISGYSGASYKISLHEADLNFTPPTGFMPFENQYNTKV